MNPSRYTQWEGGPFWNSNLSMISVVDAIVPLLFSGVPKSTHKLTDIQISETKKKTSFNLIQNDLLGPISVMGLD